jgi:hypothetical protein
MQSGRVIKSSEVFNSFMLGYAIRPLLQRAVPSLAKYGCVAFDMDYTLARCSARYLVPCSC